MNHVNKLQILYGWTPNYRLVFKKPAHQGLKIPQFVATQGWIILTYDKGIPVCLWVTSKEIKELTISLDERLFGDTIFRAEKISGYEHNYVISDIFIYASTNIFNITTFSQRYEWLKKLIPLFYKFVPGLTELYLKDAKFPIKGYEYYDDIKGSKGSYSEHKEIVYKTEIPDVYFVKGKTGYISVPDLKTSEFLRSKSVDSEFELDIEEIEGVWYIKSFI